MRRIGKLKPIAWVREVLGGEPWSAQQKILTAVKDHREVAVKSCHGIGKDWIAARVVLWFLYNHKPSIVISTAPTLRQVRGILWKEISVAHRNAHYDLGGKMLTQELKLDSDWWAWGFTAPERDPDRFQGFHEENVLVVIDEAAGISPEIYTAIEGIMSSVNARKLEIGNPTDPVTPFAESFKTPGIHKISVTAFETPNFTEYGITEEDIADGSWEEKQSPNGPPHPYLVTPEWVAKRYNRWGPDNPLYLSRVLAQFPDEGVDTLIPLRLIEAAQQRTLEPKGKNILGVDIARYGDDQSVIMQRRGPVLRTLHRFTKTSTMETTGHIVRALKDTGAEIAQVDVVGIGAGVVDRLDELDKPVAAASAGSKSSDPDQYANARAEWFWGLRSRFESGDIDIDPVDEELMAQLASLKWKADSRGRIMIESKDDMKKRGLESPDDADAASIAFAQLSRFSYSFGADDGDNLEEFEDPIVARHPAKPVGLDERSYPSEDGQESGKASGNLFDDDIFPRTLR